MSKKLKKAESNLSGTRKSTILDYHPITEFLVAAVAHDIDLGRNRTISTFKRYDGSLIHTSTQGEHDRYEKVPDVHFVGWGYWIYEND